MSGEWKSCFTCSDYADVRKEAIAIPLADKAEKEGRDVIEVVDEFHVRRARTAPDLRATAAPRWTYPSHEPRVRSPRCASVAGTVRSRSRSAVW